MLIICITYTEYQYIKILGKTEKRKGFRVHVPPVPPGYGTYSNHEFNIIVLLFALKPKINYVLGNCIFDF